MRAIKIKSLRSTQNLKRAGRDYRKTFKNREIYQQFIVRAVDDHNKPIKDYTIEFFVYKYNGRYIRNGEFTKRRSLLKKSTGAEDFMSL